MNAMLVLPAAFFLLASFDGKTQVVNADPDPPNCSPHPGQKIVPFVYIFLKRKSFIYVIVIY